MGGGASNDLVNLKILSKSFYLLELLELDELLELLLLQKGIVSLYVFNSKSIIRMVLCNKELIKMCQEFSTNLELELLLIHKSASMYGPLQVTSGDVILTGSNS